MHSHYRRIFRSYLLILPVTLLGFAYLNAQDTTSAPAHLPAAQSYRVGLKSIIIPSPLSEMTEIGSDYRVVLEPLAPATNRLVAAFNRPEDLNQILTGGSAPLTRSALVEVLRRAEFTDIDAASFKTVEDSVAQEFGGDLDAIVKRGEDNLNRNLKEMNSNASSVTMAKPFSLGALFSKPDVAAFGMIESVSAQGPEAKMAASIMVVRVQNRILFLYLYSAYKDESTVQWIRSTSEQWADAVIAANKQ